MKVGLSLGLAAYRGGGTALGPELLTNGDFAGAGPPPTLGTDWSIGSGVATKIPGGVTSTLSWTGLTLTPGRTYRAVWTVTAYAAGIFTARLLNGTTVIGPNVTALGTYTHDLVAVAGNSAFAIQGGTIGSISVDNVSLREVL
jgi:hypothetical protein